MSSTSQGSVPGHPEGAGRGQGGRQEGRRRAGGNVGAHAGANLRAIQVRERARGAAHLDAHWGAQGQHMHMCMQHMHMCMQHMHLNALKHSLAKMRQQGCKVGHTTLILAKHLHCGGTNIQAGGEVGCLEREPGGEGTQGGTVWGMAGEGSTKGWNGPMSTCVMGQG